MVRRAAARDVLIDADLRAQTADTANRLHALIACGRTPAPAQGAKCEHCSFLGSCLPKTVGKRKSAQDYLQIHHGRLMKKHLNTLYVTTQGAYLFKDGETVAVKVENETRLRLPMHTLDGIVCFGRVSCSPYLMGACAERDVAVSFLTENGRFLARVQGPVSGNVLLRREQYRRADDETHTASVARAILVGKLANSRTVLRRALRDHRDKIDADGVEKAATHISALLNELNVQTALNVLRGIEGDAARTYFGAFDHLITANKDQFRFQRS